MPGYPQALARGYLQVASNPLGGRLLQEVGPLASGVLKNGLMAFAPEMDSWRLEKLSQVALIGSDLVVKVLSDPHRPPSVKRSFYNLILTFAGSGQRDRWRGKYGVAPALWVIDWTNRCNLHCYGCYANAYQEGDDLPFEVVDWLITELKEKFGVHYIVLSGGEPFIRWPDMARMAAEHRDVVFMVYTNATLINEKVIAGLRQLGNIVPCLSVEGFEKETDRRRGKGHFAFLVNLMERLTAAGIIFGFSATVTSENAETLYSDEFIKLCIRMGCLFGWYFLYVPIGRNPQVFLMVRPEQRSALAEQVNRWRALRLPIFLGDFWNDGCLTEGCIAAGRRYGHIDGQGNVKTCVFCPFAAAKIRGVRDIVGGETEFNSLADVIFFSPVFQWYRWAQKQIRDWTGPCPIIDHPELLGEIWKRTNPIPTNSMPDGFIDGAIASELASRAKAWRERWPRERYLQGSRFEFLLG